CKMKRYGDALTCFDKVLEIEPDNALAKTTRALVIAIMPQMDEAILEKPDGGDSLDFYKIRKILDDVFDYGLGW
ncbi:MAG: tetratricopeptide repeat protein, partial [Cyanobacteria bacterium J06628_3]